MLKIPTRAEVEREVRVDSDSGPLEGSLALPEGAQAIVVFAHGSGSSRHSPRNRLVAEVLHDGGLATLLFDLLTPQEEVEDIKTARLRFDMSLLSRRLAGATEWVQKRRETRALKVGYFGASSGAGAALVAAAERPHAIFAVVSRGGRPDLAGLALARVLSPTLLIVGGRDDAVLRLNREALQALGGPGRLEVIAGASHLFEEPGALETVAALARDWFLHHAMDGAKKSR